MLPVITGAVTLISAIGIAAEKLAKAKEASNKTLGAMSNLKTRDLITLTKVARMEPIVLIDESLKFDPVMPDVMQIITSLIAGYYTQAFGVLGSVDGVDVLGTLDKLNPARTGIGLNNLDEPVQARKLPVKYNTGFYNIGLEAIEEEARDDKPKQPGVNVSVDKSVIADINQASNLIVGKMIKVTLTRGGQSIEIPITIRPTPVTTATEAVIGIMSLASTKNTVKERWHRFKSGELTWKNMVFADDVIKEHKDVLIKDTSGVYAELVRRARANASKGMASGNLSLATDSNIIVITDTTAIKVGREVGGNLDSFDIRERVFSHIYSNILVIVNQRSNMVTFYYRGQRMGNTQSYGELKLSNKSGGPDVMSIFKAFAENKIPAL